MSAVPVWAGIIVRALAASLPWYEQTTGALRSEEGEHWAALRFPDGSAFELYEGDPARPGLVFPSYGEAAGPPVMPGFDVADAEEAAAGLRVARALPGWIVAIAPGGLRVVLTERESDPRRGLVGFRITAPVAAELADFLAGLGAPCPVTPGPRWQVVPVVAGRRAAELTDPDGNPLVLVRAPT